MVTIYVCRILTIVLSRQRLFTQRGIRQLGFMKEAANRALDSKRFQVNRYSESYGQKWQIVSSHTSKAASHVRRTEKAGG